MNKDSLVFEEIPSDDNSIIDSESDEEELFTPLKKRIRLLSTSDESESSDIVENAPVHHRKAFAEKSPKWTHNGNTIPEGTFSSNVGPTQYITDLADPTPYDVVCKFITDDIIDSIVFQTNLYAEQQSNRYTPTNEQEIRAFIGINFIMGINSLPSYRDAWSSIPYLRNEYICQLMTVNRFGWLLSHIHINDNMLIPGRNSINYDKLYKIRPFIDKIQENFEKNFNPSQSLAIDESMIKFKGRCSLKQYQPKKPIKRGYKLWVLADKLGYCYKFNVYTGKIGNQVTKNLGEEVVNTLTSDLVGKEHTTYFDNYFTSVNLLVGLKSKQINACGVIKKTRKNLPNFSENIKHRGEYESLVSDTGIIATKWMDNKEVIIVSNFHSPNQHTIVQRKNRQGIKIPITCPSLIADYNNNMNAVDKFNQLMSSYSLDRRSKKWWHRIFFYLLDASVVNGYIVYKQLGKEITFKKFKGQCAEGFVAQALINKNVSKSKTLPVEISKSKPTVSLEIRRKDSKHQPIRSSRRRCALCSTKKHEVRTLWSCTVCKVPLCLGKNMCFNKYHS